MYIHTRLISIKLRIFMYFYIFNYRLAYLLVLLLLPSRKECECNNFFLDQVSKRQVRHRDLFMILKSFMATVSTYMYVCIYVEDSNDRSAIWFLMRKGIKVHVCLTLSLISKINIFLVQNGEKRKENYELCK